MPAVRRQRLTRVALHWRRRWPFSGFRLAFWLRSRIRPTRSSLSSFSESGRRGGATVLLVTPGASRSSVVESIRASVARSPLLFHRSVRARLISMRRRHWRTGILWFLFALAGRTASSTWSSDGGAQDLFRQRLFAAGATPSRLVAPATAFLGNGGLVTAMFVRPPLRLPGACRNACGPTALVVAPGGRTRSRRLPHLLLGGRFAKEAGEEVAVAFRNAVRLRSDNADAYLKLACPRN
jgi:hypothetical protein